LAPDEKIYSKSTEINLMSAEIALPPPKKKYEVKSAVVISLNNSRNKIHKI